MSSLTSQQQKSVFIGQCGLTERMRETEKQRTRQRTGCNFTWLPNILFCTCSFLTDLTVSLLPSPPPHLSFSLSLSSSPHLTPLSKPFPGILLSDKLADPVKEFWEWELVMKGQASPAR